MLAPNSTFPNDTSGYQKALVKNIMAYLSPEALASLKAS
jgi:hypothetical protein